MAAELGVAYVSIVPEARGLGRKIAKEFGAVDKAAESTGRSSGSKLMGALGVAAKKAAMGALVGAGVAAGAALMGGFASAVNQQTAQKVLSGLYGSASQATQMMEDLRKVSSTSPIEYGAYTKAAEALAYAGVEGDQAVSVLENVGHAITATGGTSEHMDRATSAVTKMVNAGKVSLDSLQELSGSGVPIISGLADHFGVSMEDINKMASEGAIGLEDVVSVMENATGDNFQMSLQGSASAAQSFGNQFKIAKDNIVTAIGSSLVPMLEKIAPSIAPVSDAIVNGIEKLPEIFDRVKNAAQTVLGVLRTWSPVIFGVVAAIAAWNIVQGISNALSWAAYLWQSRYVLMGAARIAVTNAMAVAQRGLNMAMRANPIGLIISAIMLLIGAFVMAYQNVDWFREMVDTAWAWIKNAISVVVDWFVNTAWPWMQEAIAALGAWFTMLYTDYIKPAWDGIWGAIQTAWNFISPIFDFIVNAIKTYLIIYFQLLWTAVQIVWKSIEIAIQVAWQYVIKPIWDAIVAFIRDVLVPRFNSFMDTVKVVWSAIQTAIQWAWRNIIKPIWDAIVAFLRDTLAPRFRSFQSTVKTVWNGIKSAIDTVWKFVRDKVFDPLKTAISETVPNAFERGKDAIGEAWDKLKDVAKKPVKFVIETIINKGIIGNFNKIAKTFGVDEIDKVSLPKGFATGGYTGAGRKMKPAGVVHADEYVIRKESQRKISRTHGRGVLDHMNRFGTIPGYASGGKVGGTLIDAANWWIAKGARGSRHPAFGGAVRSGHSRNSLHYQDRAVDLNYGPGGQNATEMAFFDRWVSDFKSMFPGIRVIWRAPGHYNHMHIDTANGADIGDFSGASSGGGNILSFLNPFEALFDKIKTGITGSGQFGELVGGAAKKMVEAPIEWIKSKADLLSDVGENVRDVVTTGSGRARGRAWATAQGWPLVGSARWKALDYIISRESSWNPNAKNPRSSASGLGQFIDANARHYLGSAPMRKHPFDDQLKAVIRYTDDRYGGLVPAMNYWKRNNHYATGGHVTPTLYDKGGILQPGTSLVANKTRKPEYILPAKVTDALMSGSAVSGGDTWNIYGPDPDQVSREIIRERRKREALSGGVLV